MTSMNYLALRRQTLAKNLKKEGVGADAALITCPVNVTYLTGFTGDASYFIVAPKNCVLVSDQRFEVQIKEECPEFAKGQELDLHIRPHNRTTLEVAAEVLGKCGAKSVAVEASRLTLSEFEALKELAPKLTFVPHKDLVESIRAVKDPGEVERMREAVRVAERAYRMFLATVRETDTEKDMADALDGYLRRAGARGSAFPPIDAVGDRAALPHAPPGDRPLEVASKVLIDWGADLVYKSDITRTLRSPFGIAPTRRNKFERVGFEFEEVYQVVLDAQNAALAALHPGAKAKDVDAAARKVIASAKLRSEPSAKLGDFFTHGLGHGIGLEVHEAPRIRANSEDVIETGMIVTLEPAVYIPGWGGIRIEDEVLITRDSCTLLTSLPREVPAPAPTTF